MGDVDWDRNRRLYALMNIYTVAIQWVSHEPPVTVWAGVDEWKARKAAEKFVIHEPYNIRLIQWHDGVSEKGTVLFSSGA